MALSVVAVLNRASLYRAMTKVVSIWWTVGPEWLSVEEPARMTAVSPWQILRNSDCLTNRMRCRCQDHSPMWIYRELVIAESPAHNKTTIWQGIYGRH